MAVALAIRFPSGRYHSTPWGRHVNEGTPEWPPSPWRLLRAMIATWKRKLEEPFKLDLETVQGLLTALTELPEFVLPPASAGHSRHYMPWSKGEKTLVFDAFVALAPEVDVVALWPNVTLPNPQHRALSLIASHLSFLGRAEAWCMVRVLSEEEAKACRPNCSPLNLRNAERGMEPIRVLCADPQTAFANEHTPKQPRKGLKERTKATLPPPLYDPDWHLCIETLELHAKKWSDPPGSRWVTYLRSSDCFQVEPRRQPMRSRAPLTVARYAIDAAVLPLVRDTLPLAELARMALMSQYRRVEQRALYGKTIPPDALKPVSRAISGKDAEGNPLEGHQHAFYLPSDDDGDGRIDHLTILAEMGFGDSELKAIDRLRQLCFADAAEPLNLLLVGLGTRTDVSTPLFRASARWISATPFVVTRHAKHDGRKRDRPELLGPENEKAFAAQVLREELERLRARRPDLPAVLGIEPLDDHRMGAHRLRPLQFHRSRRKRNDDGGRRPAGAFRICFAGPASGPICLGHSSHFGLGLFVPEEMSSTAARL